MLHAKKQPYVCRNVVEFAAMTVNNTIVAKRFGPGDLFQLQYYQPIGIIATDLLQLQ